MNRKNQELIIGYRFLMASAFSFSLMSVCVKHLNGRIPVAEIVFARAITSLAITRLMLRSKGISPWGKNKKLLILRGAIGTAALFCVFAAINELTLASATIIQYTYPTFLALGGWLFLKESINLKTILGIIVGWTGIVFIAMPYGVFSIQLNNNIIYIMIALIGAFLTSIAYLLVRKLSTTEHPLVIVHYFPLMSVPLTIPFLFNNLVLPEMIDLIWLAGVGVFTQLGQVWITKGLSQVAAVQASSANYSQVLFAAIWGIIIFGEIPNIYTMTGASLVFFSTIASIRTNKKYF